jgi:hypothetical protein
MSLQAAQSVNPTLDHTALASTVELRIEGLGYKLDELLAAFRIWERTADSHWRSIAEQNSSHLTEKTAAGTNGCSDIGVQFEVLRQRRDALRLLLNGVDAPQGWTSELEIRADAELNPIAHRLYSLAHALASSPARSDDDLRFKALAIHEYCEENSDDIVHVLAASLAADVLARGMLKAPVNDPL